MKFKTGDYITLKKITRARPVDIMMVSEVKGDKVHCFPQGGGFSHIIPIDEMRFATKEELNPSFYESYFTLDGLEEVDDQGKYIGQIYFRGITDGSAWNGWAKPWFTKEEGLRMVNLPAFSHYPIPTFGYDEERDEFWEIPDAEGGDGATREYQATMEHNGVRYHGIGTGWWCWDELNKKRPDDVAAVKRQFPDAQ